MEHMEKEKERLVELNRESERDRAFQLEEQEREARVSFPAL